MSWYGRRRHVLMVGLASLTPLNGLAQPAVIRVSTNNTPLDRKALQALSEEAFRRLSLGFELLALPSERSLLAANDGEVDGEGLRVAGLSQPYPQLIQVPEPYVNVRFVAFAIDGSIRLEEGWNSLKPYRVAFIHGWKTFETHASSARIVNKVDKPEQLFQMLDHGHVDLALYTLADGEALARAMGLTRIVAVAPALQDVQMYLYLHRRHETLVPQLARTLREMKADGSFDRIVKASRRP